MRQRNDSGYPLTVNTDPPQVVPPGEEIDYDMPVVGFTEVPAAKSTAAAKTSRSSGSPHADGAGASGEEAGK